MSHLKQFCIVLFAIALFITFVPRTKLPEISMHRVVVSIEQRTGLPLSWLKQVLQPQARYKDHVFDGKVKTKHPRIVFSSLSDWDGKEVPDQIKSRLNQYQQEGIRYYPQCGRNSLLALVVCNLTSTSPSVTHQLIEKMKDTHLSIPYAGGSVSNGWLLALAYDFTQPFLSAEDKKDIEKKIIQALKDTLAILDENSSSLWHTRSSHASASWIMAITLSSNDENELLRVRAQGHFLGAIEALSYTEIWPEGYNYWIQNRAFLFALASSAYLNGLDEIKNGKRVKELMRKVGYWHIYATRPDNRIEGYGDEGSRVDLKDETRRVIDLIVQITKDPIIAGYSKYLEKLYGPAAYYRGYRWGFLLFNDPSVPAVGDGSFASLGPYLEKARLFGEDTTNYGYLRSGWAEEDTFVTFKAGHTFTHHGHYDAGHFTVFKGAPLAINSSTYGDYYSEHRLGYAIRTVAKNSLLVLKPEEVVSPNHFFKKNVSDGGQRVTLPTGSAITSMKHWKSNFRKGLHLEGAELLAKKIDSERYHYFSVDLTPAYNNTIYDENDDGGKVSKVIRDFLYLPNEDHIVIYDRVTSTGSSYTKKWLLHTVARPKIEQLNVLKGSLDNGIAESLSSVARINNKKGHLKVTKILPRESIFRTVGGVDYQYYVETDGDEASLNGKNYSQGSDNKPWFDVGLWRLELQPTIPAKSHEFLVVLSPSLGKTSEEKIIPAKINGKNAVGVITKKSTIIFIKDNSQRKLIIDSIKKNQRILLVGLKGSGSVSVEQNGKTLKTLTINGAITELELAVSELGQMKIRW